jgi:hypothetical protein
MSSRKPGSSKTRGLPVAKPIDESSSTGGLASLLSEEGLTGEPLSISELARNKPSKRGGLPQWFWFALAGGTVLVVILLLILVLSQLG